MALSFDYTISKGILSLKALNRTSLLQPQANIFASKDYAKGYHRKGHQAENTTLIIGDEVKIKQRKLNNLTTIIESTPCIVVYTKGALIKAKGENSDHVVTRNISHFFRIPKDTFFPNSTSD